MWILFLLIQIIVFRIIFKKLNLPSFICYLFIGILNGSNSLNLIPSFLTNSYGIVSLISLIIIFARASSQIKISLLNKNNSHIFFKHNSGIIRGFVHIFIIYIFNSFKFARIVDVRIYNYCSFTGSHCPFNDRTTETKYCLRKRKSHLQY